MIITNSLLAPIPLTPISDEQLHSRYPSTISCSCKSCAKMCHNPCWPTAEEANKILDAGFARRLTIHLHCYTDDDYNVHFITLLAGKRVGRYRYCSFYSGGLCRLHTLNIKPIEGRHALHGRGGGYSENIREDIASTWNTELGKLVLARWNEESKVP